MLHLPAVPRRIAIAATLLALVIALGTLGYVAIEGWGAFDSFYMTVTTLTTVGGGEARPLSIAGRWWTLAVVMVGFGVLTYTLLALVGYLLEGHFGVAVELQRMRRQVARMTDHFILCGFGRVGREIARDFTAERIPFVIIDINADSLQRAAAEGHRVVNGNASEVSVLSAAGIERARGLVTAIDSDADNIYVTLSARVLRPDIFIVARANRGDSEPKLRLAGANRIISPYTIGGRRMASLAMRPTAVEFVDTILSAGNSELLLEDFTISANSGWADRALSTLTNDAEDIIVLAIKRGDTMLFRPAGTTPLFSGDELVAAGSPAAIRVLEDRLSPP
ncbi:MAG: TrkA family potassium uptake protein [Candidatus Velthaea sp.]